MRTTLVITTIVAGVFIYDYYQRKRQPPVYVNDIITGDFNARTVPPVGIFVSTAEKDNAELMEHERRHWEQYQKMGLLKYYWQYFKEIHNFGYDAMPMEKEVRTNETAYCQQNYTECVRTGKAKTVHNPEFRS